MSVPPVRTGATFIGPVVAVERGASDSPARAGSAGAGEGTTGRVWLGLQAGAPVYVGGGRATLADVRVGALIRAWVSVPILPSDPGQAVADSIVVDAPGVSGSIYHLRPNVALPLTKLRGHHGYPGSASVPSSASVRALGAELRS